MKKCITGGIVYKSFKYILFTIIFLIAFRSLYGYNYNNSFEEMNLPKNILKLFGKEIQENFAKHILIHQMLHYLGILLLACCLHKYEIYASRRELEKSAKNSSEEIMLRQHTKIILIQYIPKNYFSLKRSFFTCLIVCFLWVVEENLIIIYKEALKDLDFWFFDIVIVSYFNVKMFKVKIYNHQILASALNIIPLVLKIVTIIISYKNNDSEILYISYKWLIPVGIVFFIILITIRAYAISKIKWLIDLKYISPTKLLIFHGIIGVILCNLACLFTTLKSCENPQNLNYLCNVTYINSTNKKYYFDHLGVYFDNFKKANFLEIFVEILIILLGMCTLFGHKFFSLLVIKYLTPVHLIFTFPIFYFFDKISLIINNLIIDKKLFKEDVTIDNKGAKFILDISGDLLSFIGFIIFLEIIELNFCSFNYDTKRNITGRSYDESYGISKVNDINNSLFNAEVVEEIANDEDLSSNNS